MIVLQRFVRLHASLCKEHGLPLARQYLNKTLVQGWWGIVSFFANFYAVYTDLKAMSTLRKLGEPVGPSRAPSEAVPPPIPPPP
jgi:hypothetical protein